MEAILPIFFVILGLAVGSFLNVALLRFGFSERPMERSHCAACGLPIRWFDLIPVLSYVNLGGKCRTCGSSINAQYPLVELATGILFALSYSLVPVDLTIYSFANFFGLLLFSASLVAIVAYDIRHTLIPMPFVFSLWTAAAVMRVSEALLLQSYAPLLDATYGALSLGGFFALTFLVTRGRGMGLGDSYIAAGIGAALGLIRGIESVMIGVWTGTILYLALLFFSSVRILPNKLRVTMKSELPFAPWLMLGATVSLFTNFSPIQEAQHIIELLWK